MSVYDDKLLVILTHFTFSSPFTVGRYHSLVIEKESFPTEELEITAWTEDGLIMAARHKKYKHLQVTFIIPLFGIKDFIRIQFNLFFFYQISYLDWKFSFLFKLTKILLKKKVMHYLWNESYQMEGIISVINTLNYFITLKYVLYDIKMYYLHKIVSKTVTWTRTRIMLEPSTEPNENSKTLKRNISIVFGS